MLKTRHEFRSYTSTIQQLEYRRGYKAEDRRFARVSQLLGTLAGTAVQGSLHGVRILPELLGFLLSSAPAFRVSRFTGSLPTFPDRPYLHRHLELTIRARTVRGFCRFSRFRAAEGERPSDGPRPRGFLPLGFSALALFAVVGYGNPAVIVGVVPISPDCGIMGQSFSRNVA